MKLLDRLRNSKGTLDMSKFSEFEKQQNLYKKNLTESSNLIQKFNGGGGVRSTSVSKRDSVMPGAHNSEISSKGFFNKSIHNS